MTKKGFLFVVTVFLILTYILLSISVWVKAVETSERAYSEFYKESTVELAIEQITPAKVDAITNIILNRGLFRLNGMSIDNEVKDGTALGDENAYTRQALFELLVNGSANASYFTSGPGLPREAGSSLTDWVSNLNTSLLAIGVYADDFQVSGFNMGQSSVDKVDYSFDLKLKLRDYSNTSSVSRIYHINNSVAISGLVDPAIARESKDKVGDSLTVYRQFFFNKDYPQPSSLKVENKGSASSGQGWLYGYLASASGSTGLIPSADSVPMGQRKGYILVGSFSEINALTPEVYEQFGGFIVRDSPTNPDSCSYLSNASDPDSPVITIPNEGNTFNPIAYGGENCTQVYTRCSTGACTNLPFVVSGFNPADALECPLLGDNGSRQCVLMVAGYLPEQVSASPTLKNSGGGIYGIESVRDFVMCGYYTQDGSAPSYLQRLLPDSYNRTSSLGIETFVIGEYANSSAYDLNSRLDRELFNNVPGIRIRGLAGCKSFDSCADPAPPLGIFAVGAGTLSTFNLNQIACPPGGSGAGCG